MTEQEEFDLYIESLHNPEDAAGLRKIVKTRTALQLLLAIDDYKEMLTKDRQLHIDYDSGCQYIMSTDPEIVKTLQPSETHKLQMIEYDNGYVTVIYDNHFRYTVDFYGNVGYRLSKLMTTAEGSKQAIDECFDDEDGLDDYEVEYYATEAANAAQ